MRSAAQRPPVPTPRQARPFAQRRTDAPLPYPARVTYVCVPIFPDRPVDALDDARLAAAAGADLIEWRVDRLYDGSNDAARAVRRLCRESPLPCVVTCRAEREGGESELEDGERIALYEELVASDHPPRCVDVEWSALEAAPDARERLSRALERAGAERRASVIVSLHDFQGRPADLTRRLLAMRGDPLTHILKVAFRARSLRDNLELFDLLRERDRPTIALAMGEFGLLSRALAPKFGAFLTFAALRDEALSAPGQPTLRDLVQLFRFRSVRASTRVCGVVGWPVSRSLSPLVHNAAFDAAGFDGVYLPLPVPPEWEHFKATVGALADHEALHLHALSVTAPHKQHLVRLARERGWEIDPGAARANAANTLVGGRVSDTDGPAAVSLLRDALGELAAKRITILGAGGVARAIGAALLDAGAAVTVCARRAEQADELARALGAGAKTAPWDARARTPADAVVNCTTVGMDQPPPPEGAPPERAPSEGAPPEAAPASGVNAARADALPIDVAGLHAASPRAVVFETVYRPPETPLLRAARAHNTPVVDGAAFFVRQAEAQSRLFTNAAPPAGLVERLARERLRAP